MKNLNEYINFPHLTSLSLVQALGCSPHVGIEMFGTQADAKDELDWRLLD